MDETNEKKWPEVSFEDLSDKLKDACGRAGWTTLMPVQSRTMAAVFDRKDIMVQARTGSGKTGAFVLPLIERIDPEKNCCQALVLLPTRELAKQVADEAENLSGGKVRTVPVYGGVGYGPQVDGFRKGAHLVVGTPGRILDHLMRGNLDVSQLDTLVFDEADRMLSIGFYPDMKQLQSYLPERDIHGLMFSATFPPLVLRLSEEFLRDPQFISLSEDHVHVAEVTHAYYQVPGMGKERALARLIETENPSSAIIFTNTKANCNFVAAVLSQFGYNADPLSSDLSQAKREQVLNRVRAGTLRFLVATDVAARGIDIPELSHVFLYEPPEDRESYIHRSGRTGRAGAAGEVISLVDLMQKMELKRIGEHYRIPLVERELPDDKTVRSVVAERTTALLEARLREVPEPERERLSLLRSMAADLAAKVDSVGYLAMLLDEFYHLSVHGVSAPVRKGPAEGDNPVLDEGRIADHLERDWKSMKPLSRERMMKFMPLARSL
ncbi:MAG: DEAD/DEAH box helicase, partial [Proteobacteria bacterium]|nr:DEAD/DEAH box helicase [Pseudomonadota bacterium]